MFVCVYVTVEVLWSRGAGLGGDVSSSALACSGGWHAKRKQIADSAAGGYGGKWNAHLHRRHRRTTRGLA